jgi:ribosomal protein L39E
MKRKMSATFCSSKCHCNSWGFRRTNHSFESSNILNRHWRAPKAPPSNYTTGRSESLLWMSNYWNETKNVRNVSFEKWCHYNSWDIHRTNHSFESSNILNRHWRPPKAPPSNYASGWSESLLLMSNYWNKTKCARGWLLLWNAFNTIIHIVMMGPE